MGVLRHWAEGAGPTAAERRQPSIQLRIGAASQGAAQLLAAAFDGIRPSSAMTTLKASGMLAVTFLMLAALLIRKASEDGELDPYGGGLIVGGIAALLTGITCCVCGMLAAIEHGMQSAGGDVVNV